MNISYGYFLLQMHPRFLFMSMLLSMTNHSLYSKTVSCLQAPSPHSLPSNYTLAMPIYLLLILQDLAKVTHHPGKFFLMPPSPKPQHIP